MIDIALTPVSFRGQRTQKLQQPGLFFLYLTHCLCKTNHIVKFQEEIPYASGVMAWTKTYDQGMETELN